MDKDYIICRCEEVTLKEVEDAIQHGAHNPDEIKKCTRAGMGLCQGRICSTLITQLLEQSGYPPQHITPPHSRMPARPVKIKEYLEDIKDE